MARAVAPALRAFCAGLIDYAGTFPPAALSFEEAREQYARYRNGDDAWMLGRFVVEASRADLLPVDWPLSVLSNSDHTKAAAIECKQVVHTAKPTYCEVPLDELPEVKRAGSFAKFRCADAATEQIAGFITLCLALNLPAKFTAGLHEPLRQNGSHGFVNVFAGAAFAFAGFSNFPSILDEEDPAAFNWADKLSWRGYTLSTLEIERARREFVHSFGSCSFEEPVTGLRNLDWL